MSRLIFNQTNNFLKSIIKLNNLNNLQKFRFYMMSSNEFKSLISVCQHTCNSNKDENFNVFKKLITESSNLGCKLIFLPECFDMVCENKKKIFDFSEYINGQLINKYQDLAINLKVWLFLGGLHERRDENEHGKLSNSHIVINDNGKIVSVYRKLHLFNLDIPGTRLLESEFSVSGNCVESPVDTPVGKVGLGICYDLRFPEFAISLAKAGANILTYPSSFTVKTGNAHWESLLRARAIENQCYVVAAAQTGIHNEKRSSYGHSMIVDPWGEIIAQVGDKTGYAIAEIDLDYLKNIRSRLPIWNDRKPECYGEIYINKNIVDEIDKVEEYVFGQVKIKSNQVFLKTNYSYAFVNNKPILPGHVLISSLRKVDKFTKLTLTEVSDLFRTVQKVEKLLEKKYNADSCTICMQDGKNAGQSIDHVHVHVVPRKSTDFNGKTDKIYLELFQSIEKLKNIKSEEKMAEESNDYRYILKHEIF